MLPIERIVLKRKTLTSYLCNFIYTSCATLNQIRKCIVTTNSNKDGLNSKNQLFEAAASHHPYTIYFKKY